MDEKELNGEGRIAQLLEQWRAGDRAALAELTPIVYRELHRLATRYIHRATGGHTLHATVLVNEAFVRLGAASQSFMDSGHFYVVAARLMRHILVEHAKARLCVKGDGGGSALADSDDPQSPAGGMDLIEIDAALSDLEKHNPNAASAAELHYFGGMTMAETAAVLGMPAATIKGEIRFARAWLVQKMRLSKVPQ